MALIDINFILPFFFILAIVYGSLEVSKVFQNKGVKAIIALVIAIFAASSPVAVEFILFILPYATIFFVVFFLFGFVASYFKQKEGEEKDFTVIAAVLAIVLLFLASQESMEFISIEDSNFVGMIVLLVIALILYAVYKIK